MTFSKTELKLLQAALGALEKGRDAEAAMLDAAHDLFEATEENHWKICRLVANLEDFLTSFVSCEEA
jgi:hypothetical protein